MALEQRRNIDKEYQPEVGTTRHSTTDLEVKNGKNCLYTDFLYQRKHLLRSKVVMADQKIYLEKCEQTEKSESVVILKEKKLLQG